MSSTECCSFSETNRQLISDVSTRVWGSTIIELAESDPVGGAYVGSCGVLVLIRNHAMPGLSRHYFKP